MRVAEGLPETWLSDAVKGYLSPRGEFESYRALENLQVFVATPAYSWP